MVGGQAVVLAEASEHCEVLDALRRWVSIDNEEEEGEQIAVCTTPRQDWTALWPSLRHLE